MDETGWQDIFERELKHALSARHNGNEGKSRVCARRAAGIVVGEYFQRRGITRSDPSAYDRLRFLLTIPDLPDDVIRIAGHFLLRITEARTLPIEADLIADARWLAENLLVLSPDVPPSTNSR